MDLVLYKRISEFKAKERYTWPNQDTKLEVFHSIEVVETI